MTQLDTNAIEGCTLIDTVTVDEPAVSLDLNGDGDMTDAGVSLLGILTRTNPAGLNLDELIINY